MWQVNEYIDPKDVGLDGPWCPLVYGKEALGCQRPTFEQLLQVGGPSPQEAFRPYPGPQHADLFAPPKL